VQDTRDSGQYVDCAAIRAIQNVEAYFGIKVPLDVGGKIGKDMEGHSLTPVLQVIAQAWSDGFTTRSDFARSNAEAVAEAACRGLITTLNVITGQHGKSWLVTPKGCKKLFKEMS
jgi:hypothetical protein